MIRNSVDLPAPFGPSTPILAPGYIEMLMFSSTWRSGGWNRESPRMVKMNCGGMAARIRGGPGREDVGVATDEQFYGPDQAAIHDERFGDLATQAARLVLDELARAGLHDGTIVDLGCGSG